MSQRHTAAAHPQLLAAAATGVEGFIRSYRLCPDRLFGQAGIDAGALGSPMARLDLAGYCTLMELGAAQSGDPCFGLGYGQKFTPEMLGLIGYVAISSPDLMTAAANLARYFRHHQQGTVTELAFAEPFCTLSYRIDPARVARRRQDALVTLGMFCNVFRHAAGPDWCPDAVELEEDDRGDRAAIEAAFGAPVRFGRPTNALLFRPERARHAMPQADAMLNSLLCANLVGLGMGEATPDLRAQVQAEMRANLATPDLDLEQIGEKLGMTRWTLQRRLAEEGTSFAQLLDELRRELACRWLLDRSLQIGTVSERLGYSEPSAFVRAFRRWQQVSPSDYRRAALAPRH